MPKSFYFYLMEKLFPHEESCIPLYWRNVLNKEIIFVYPYFSVWLKGNLGVRNSHVIKLMVNDWKEWITFLSCEPSLIAVLFFFVFFCFFYFPSWYQFIFVKFIFWKFHCTYFSYNCYNYSMFRVVPECFMFPRVRKFLKFAFTCNWCPQSHNEKSTSLTSFSIHQSAVFAPWCDRR